MNIRSASAELKTAANTSPHTVRLSGLTLRPILVVGLGVLEWQAW